MLSGKDVWDFHVTSGMEKRKIGNRSVYTYDDLRNNFYEILQDTVKLYPDKTAFCDNWDRRYTYKEFKKLVDNFSGYLQKKAGVKKKSHVGILLDSSIEFCTAFYAICKLGAVAIPFPSKYKEAELRTLCNHADLDVLICMQSFSSWACEYEKNGLMVIYSVDEDHGYGFRHITYHGDIEKGSVGELTDEVIMMFTSGTTSASKGVILKNYNIVHAVMAYQRALGVTSQDKTIIPVPIYHVTGLIALLGLFVYIGGTVYLHKRYDAERILQCIIKHDITFMHGSPTVYGMLLDYKETYPELKSICTMACGSSYMPIEKIKLLHNWMPAMRFQIVYGMTETASPGTIFPYDAATTMYKGSAGKPIPGMELMIRDDKNNEIGVDGIGSIWIRGANIAEYYYKIASESIQEGWLDTGDIGYYNEDGYVFIVDRKKDMINRGGEKIWCTAVEEAILTIKGVKNVAVVGIPNEKYGEAAAAVIELFAGAVLSADEVIAELKPKLAKFKIPEKIKFVAEIPKTPGLKTDKKKIRQMF